jgi:hypothetical protein
MAFLASMILSSLCYAEANNNTKNVVGVIKINPYNRRLVTNVLPTGRIVSPVGTINGTASFPTMVVPWQRGVAVLANGATPTTNIILFSSSLHKQFTVSAFSGASHYSMSISGTKGGIDYSGFNPADGIASDVLRNHVDDAVTIDDKKGNAADKIYNLKHAGNGTGHSTPDIVVNRQNFFQGLAVGHDGTLYAAGGYTNDVVAITIKDKKFQSIHRFKLVWQNFPKNQYPYQYQARPHKNGRLFYPDAVAVRPNNKHLFVTGMLANSLARINIKTSQVKYINVGSYPFAMTFADNNHRLVVSLWGSNAVAIVNPETMKVLDDIHIEPPNNKDNIQAGVHPTALASAPHSSDVFVALSNIDRVAELNTASMHIKGFINDKPYSKATPGSYPDGLTIADGKLFVANAGNNDVAVYNYHTGKFLGLIPTGWYPTAITHSGKYLYIVAGKGLGTGPNVEYQWIGNMMDGLVQKVALDKVNASHLLIWTQEALNNNGFSSKERAARHIEDRKTLYFLHEHIKYVVFILRENKTFDEDLGDYKNAGAWADPNLDLYGPKELPNLYNLVRHYTLFVNFMADGEVTAQGHQWTTGASDSDFVQRTWPEYYSNRGLTYNPGWTVPLYQRNAFIYDNKGEKPNNSNNPYAIYENLSALGKWSNPWISYPARLFIFNELLKRHISFEDFGEFVSRTKVGIINNAMRQHIDYSFPSANAMILDTYRANEAIKWLKSHNGKSFPHFIYIWLPDDHTAGRRACYYSPNYYVANNDYATAKFIHYLSTTPEWKQMVVFLTEDDAQSGADHINAFRTFAVAVSPWVKKGYLETNLYSQVNILKTVEAVFDLPPMSQWDQNASVFSGIWTNKPDFSVTKVLPMQIPITFNSGKCKNYILLRREAGILGKTLSQTWYKDHRSKHGVSLSHLKKKNLYTPTTLLKVPGPEQFKQEWIASKGLKSYKKVIAYIRKLAKSENRPLASVLAGKLPD